MEGGEGVSAESETVRTARPARREKIAKLPTGVKTLKARSGDSTREAPMEDVPTENVIIESVKVVAE